MYQKQHTQQYLEKQIQNASPAQQIVMLYDGAIKFCLQARQAIEKGDIQARCNANQRAMEIVSYLLEILDMEKGGELGERLFRIYMHLLKRLLEVDMKSSVEAVDEVVSHLKTLRQSWQEISTEGLQQTPAQEGSTSPKNQQSENTEASVPVKRSATA